MGRYERNAPAISPAEQELLSSKRVLIAGCGGLGGYVIELLGRIGVGHLTLVDGDVFVDSNLNRQLLSTDASLGKSKPHIGAERLRAINPLVSANPVSQYIDADNAAPILAGHDVIVDALDNGPSRKILAQAASALGIPLVSGAISGWRGRVFVLTPGDNADFLWDGGNGLATGNLGFTASAVSSVLAAEAVKLLLERPGLLHNRMLEFDLLRGDWEEIPLSFE